jgi:hypothetical protein
MHLKIECLGVVYVTEGTGERKPCEDAVFLHDVPPFLINLSGPTFLSGPSLESHNIRRKHGNKH